MSTDVEQGMVTERPNFQEIGDLLVRQTLELNRQIHELTNPELPLNTQSPRLVLELGTAAYHLSTAAQIINAEPMIVEATESSHPAVETPQEPERTATSETSSEDTSKDRDERRENDDRSAVDDIVDSFCAKNKFKGKNKDLIKKTIEQFKDGQWFRVRDIDLGEITFTTPAAKKQAISKLMGQLTDLGLLINNGIDRSGRKYQINEDSMPEIKELMVVERAKPNTIEHKMVTLNGDSSTSKPGFDEKLRFRKAVVFSEKVIDFILDDIGPRDSKRAKVNVISTKLSQGLSINKETGDSVLDNLVAAEHFHYVHDKGMKYLVLGPEQSTVGEKKVDRTVKPSEHENDEIWRENDVAHAYTVLDNLIKIKGRRPGLVVGPFLKSEGIVAQSEISKYKESLMRMHKLGYIYFDQNTIPSSGVKSSERFYYSTIRFKNKKIEVRAMSDLTGIINEMASKVGSSVESLLASDA